MKPLGYEGVTTVGRSAPWRLRTPFDAGCAMIAVAYGLSAMLSALAVLPSMGQMTLDWELVDEWVFRRPVIEKGLLGALVVYRLMGGRMRSRFWRYALAGLVILVAALQIRSWFLEVEESLTGQIHWGLWLWILREKVQAGIILLAILGVSESTSDVLHRRWWVCVGGAFWIILLTIQNAYFLSVSPGPEPYRGWPPRWMVVSPMIMAIGAQAVIAWRVFRGRRNRLAMNGLLWSAIAVLVVAMLAQAFWYFPLSYLAAAGLRGMYDCVRGILNVLTNPLFMLVLLRASWAESEVLESRAAQGEVLEEAKAGEVTRRP